MTDYGEEQASELEVLTSIFPDEFELLAPGPPAHFQIHVIPESVPTADIPSDPQCHLEVTYTETYPDTIPELAVVNAQGLDESEVEQLEEELRSVGEESLGMAMIFTLASECKDRFERILEERADRFEKAEEERIAREDEAERIRHQGTRVTAESFEQWRASFMAEIVGILKQPKGEDLLTPAQRAAASVGGLLDLKSGKSTRLNGRQLFEKDKSLAKSDMAYMEEGDVDVDVALFEGMEDLDLEDEDEEDTVASRFREQDD
ncbi:ubiquitin-conjugating enzyme/RWD-like protein [Phlyctochytrium arcticum]|nr:ubiquitin-conjugating enzyme/RWD-like protein [Phlyctochytrium arcticum]